MKKTVEIFAAVFMIIIAGKREADLINRLVKERTR